VFAIPYVAMPAEMSDSPEERVRIMSFRMSFVMIGAMIGSAGAPWLVHEFGGGRSGYSTMSVVIGSVCAVSMLCAFVATRRVRLEEPTVADAAFRRQLADTLGSRDFRALLAVYLTQILSIGTLMATAPYFASRIMGAGEGLVGAMFLVMMGAGILSIPMWNSLAIRWGKRPSYLLAIALLLASSAALGLLSRESSPVLYPLMAVAGLGFGAQQVLPFAMLTDLIRSQSFGSGREGVTTGIWVAGEKLGLALGPLLAGLILELGGFRAGGSPAASQESLLAIRSGFSIVPAVLMLSSGLLLARLPAESGPRAR
jgi:Na+/melibiose symporter-like transporter